MKLREIAHSRVGDKGNISNLSLIAYQMEHYSLLQAQVTAERVKIWFGEMVQGEVQRYELPQIGALNFVLIGRAGRGCHPFSGARSPWKKFEFVVAGDGD